jgi:flagellar motor switch protein FliN
MTVERRPEDAPEPASAPSTPANPELSRLLHIQVPVIAVLAERQLKLRQVLELTIGSVIELEKRADEPLDLMVNNQPFATGRTVRAGDNFALRIDELNPVKDTIRKLGKPSEPDDAPEN